MSDLHEAIKNIAASAFVPANVIIIAPGYYARARQAHQVYLERMASPLTLFEEKVLIALYTQPDLSARQVRAQVPYKERNRFYLACDKLYQNRWYNYEDGAGLLDGQLTYSGRLKAAAALGEQREMEKWKARRNRS